MRKFSSTAVLEFKKDMNDIELKGIEGVLEGLYRKKGFGLAWYGAEKASEAFGLAYTSTSGYAMYNVLNMVAYDGVEVNHFAITTGDNGTLVMVCTEYADDSEVCTHYYGFEYEDIFPGDDE